MSEIKTLEEYVIKRIDELEQKNAELSNICSGLVIERKNADRFKKFIKNISKEKDGAIRFEWVWKDDLDYDFVVKYLGLEREVKDGE